MARSRRLLVRLAGLALALTIAMDTSISAEAGSWANYLDSFNGGVAAILNVDSNTAVEYLNATEKQLNLTPPVVEEESKLVMANVKSALNVRAEASEDAKKVGKLYKDCGGTILERANGWTKLQSGNIIGWAKDEYLLFGEEAEELADEVGKRIATITADALRVRKEPSLEGEEIVLLVKDEVLEVVSTENEEWVCVDYEGTDAYVSAEFVDISFMIDKGETMDEIKAREEAEKEAKRHKNYGQYTTDADTKLLLAALIHCEARGESYEGQLAVGAVVMNRVRSKAYPDTIHGVIYASGQFTPAMNGTVNRVYESGKIQESCIRAAEEALSGVSNVGDLTHFRRNDGRDGIVIGNHVFH
ncbi:MAG: cell wall hydrolase [Lachnospiraceae bacterium]|nr:cell wall hydrolase [Lachnospiraceae bacterium]